MADHLEPKLLTLITALGGTDSLEVNDASLLVALEAKKTKKEPLVLGKHGMSTVNCQLGGGNSKIFFIFGPTWEMIKSI